MCPPSATPITRSFRSSIERMTVSDYTSPPKETIRGFFDGIAASYDRINTLLSFSLDELWRRKAVRLILGGLTRTPSHPRPLPPRGEEGEACRPAGGFEGVDPRPASILDLGVGTGKFLRGFLKRQPWRLAVGVDFSSEMLARAKTALPAGPSLVQADLHDLPFEDGTFDLVVSSFTLRSVKDRRHFFSEVRRILRPGGRAGFLCLTRPVSLAGRALYAPYLKFYLPLMGGLLSANRGAYRFLSESIQSFPSPADIGTQLAAGGFRNIFIRHFTFGISTLIGAEN